MIVDLTASKIERQMTERQKWGAFFYGTTFYPVGSRLPDHIIREVILNGFHDFVCHRGSDEERITRTD